MDDPVQIVAGLIRNDEVRKCGQLGAALQSLMGRRNQNIFWRALIDQATKSEAQGKSKDPLAMAKLFVDNKLAVNEPLDNGDLPINVLMSRSPKLGMEALTRLPVDLNCVDRAGKTPALHCLELSRSQSLDSFDALVSMVRDERLDLKARDQGAAICFKGLAWLPLAAVSADPQRAQASMRSLVDALAGRGYDFNAARETVDVKMGSSINTPLAYCVKKAAQWLQWTQHGSKAAKVGELVWATAHELIGRGADPCLQMEAGQRVQLIELCRDSGFPAGMLQSLEAGLLAQAIGSPSAVKKAAPRRL